MPDSFSLPIKKRPGFEARAAREEFKLQFELYCRTRKNALFPVIGMDCGFVAFGTGVQLPEPSVVLVSSTPLPVQLNTRLFALRDTVIRGPVSPPPPAAVRKARSAFALFGSLINTCSPLSLMENHRTEAPPRA